LIEYDDRLKSYYPNLADCLWVVYLRSIEENKEESEGTGNFYMYSAALGRVEGELRLRDIDRVPRVNFNNSDPLLRDIGPIESDNYSIRRPYCSAALKDGNRVYHLYQARSDKTLQMWSQLDFDAVHSIVSKITYGNSGGFFSRNLLPGGRTYNDDSFREEFLEKIQEVINISVDDDRRMSIMVALEKRTNDLIENYGDVFYRFIVELKERRPDLIHDLHLMNEEQAEEFNKEYDTFERSGASFIVETEEILFE